MACNMVRFPFWEKAILVDIQYCVNFCCMAKGLSYIYTYIFQKIFFSIYGLSQDVEYVFSCVTLGNSVDCVAHQAPLSMEFSRQEYWNGLPFLTLGDLPNTGIEPVSLSSPALAGVFFTTAPPGKPIEHSPL